MEQLFEDDAYRRVILPPTEEEITAARAQYPDWKPEVEKYSGIEIVPVIDHQQVDDVLDGLMEVFYEGAFPYNLPSARLPHEPENMPPDLTRGDTEHATFMFNICYYMRGGIKSYDAVARMSALFQNRPDLFDNQRVAERAVNGREDVEADIRAALSDVRLGYQETNAEFWVENALRMVDRYDGDPRKIFAGVNDYQTCLDRVMSDNNGGDKGFKGFKEKMTSMVLYFLMDEGLIDEFSFPIPVDIHVMRFSIANELVKFPDIPHRTNLFVDSTKAALRHLYHDYVDRKGVDPLRLCDAVWLLSQQLCSITPGNVTIEPLGRRFRQGRNTILLPQKIELHNPQQIKKYDASCRECPAEGTCKFNIPSKSNYVEGVVYIRGERVTYPRLPEQALLFSTDT